MPHIIQNRKVTLAVFVKEVSVEGWRQKRDCNELKGNCRARKKKYQLQLVCERKSDRTVAKGYVGPKYGLFPYDGRNIILLNIDVKLMSNRNGV